MGGLDGSPNVSPSEVVIKAGWGQSSAWLDAVTHEICYCGGFKPESETLKKRKALTYSHQLQVTGVKRGIMADWVDSEVKELLLQSVDD